MGWAQTYAAKLVSVETAATLIRSGDRVWYPPCGSAPVDLIQAITKRADMLENVTMHTALALYPFEYLRGAYKGKIGHHTVFMGPYERKAYREGNVEVTSCQFGQIDWFTVHRVQPDVFIAEVSPPDENGYMSYGSLGTLNGDIAAKTAKKTIVQVNRETPYVHGEAESFIHVDAVHAICESDHKVCELPQIPVTEVEQQIASHIVGYIDDGATIQLGLGGVANAVGFSLEHHRELGVHSEMLTDSMVVLTEKGVITGRKKTWKPGEISCTFGLGSQKVYDFMNNNPFVKTYPISTIASEAVIAQNHSFVSINNALMCDLTGQICSESIGFDQFSAIGGQLNFVRGAALAPGGKSFLAFKSVAEKKDGSLVSRIMSVLPPGAAISTPRTDVQYVVTEYGCVDIRNQSISKRVEALISIAHPQFRDELMFEAKKNFLLI